MTAAVTERFVVGIDDTDAPEAGGTGRLMRELVERIEADALAASAGVTRHQLLDHPAIPMTRRNSAAAAELHSARSLNDLEDYVVRFIRERSEPGSDPGVAILSRHSDMPHVLAFGRRCQLEVMKIDDAGRFAAESSVRLRALGEGRGGTIGALAATGLRAGGSDGRYVGLPGIRDLAGRMTAGEIRAASAIALVFGGDGEELDRDDIVDCGNWVRPRLIDGKPVLLTRRSDEERKVWVPLDRKPGHRD